MAMAMSPSRLDPPRAAIPPTATLGNNNSVLIPRAHVRVAKRKIDGRANPRVFATLCIEKATARQPSANIPVTTTRLPRPSQRKQRIKPFVMVARELGRDDFHVVPFFNPEDWDDVEVVPTRYMESLLSPASASHTTPRTTRCVGMRRSCR